MQATMQTTCLICERTLGGESREMGYPVCHDHRKCKVCGEDIPAHEARNCVALYNRKFLDAREGELEQPTAKTYEHLEMMHARCRPADVIKRGDTITISQEEYDYLNAVRLCFIPDLDLNKVSNENITMNNTPRLIVNMNHDQRLVCIEKMHAFIAQTQIAISQSGEKRTLADREKEHAAKAKREAITSSRPTNKSSEDSQELQLGSFMELHGLTERKVALGIMKDMNNAIKQFTKHPQNLPEPIARKMAIDILKSSGRLPK